MTAMQCSKCSTDLVPAQRKRAVTGQGLIGVVIVLAGMVTAAFNLIAALLVVIVGVMVGNVGRATRTVMVCPSCGTEGPAL